LSFEELTSIEIRSDGERFSRYPKIGTTVLLHLPEPYGLGIK